MQSLYAVITEFETVIDCNAVMNQSGSVHDRVFTAKVLHDTLALSLLHIGSLWVNNTIDNVFVLRDDEAVHTHDTEVEVVDIVSLLVHIGVLCGEPRAELRRNPGPEVMIANLAEPLHLSKVVSMDFLGDLES